MSDSRSDFKLVLKKRRQPILALVALLALSGFFYARFRNMHPESASAVAGTLIEDAMSGNGQVLIGHMYDEDLQNNKAAIDHFAFILQEVRQSTAGFHKVDVSRQDDNVDAHSGFMAQGLVDDKGNHIAYDFDLYDLDGQLKGPILLRLIDTWVLAKTSQKYASLPKGVESFVQRADGFREARKVFEPLGVKGFVGGGGLLGKFHTWDEHIAFYEKLAKEAQAAKESGR